MWMFCCAHVFTRAFDAGSVAVIAEPSMRTDMRPGRFASATGPCTSRSRSFITSPTFARVPCS